MNVTTFRDFSWQSHHHLPSKFGAAANLHWHSYTARFWFTDAPDQDELPRKLAATFGKLHGSPLNTHIGAESTDEAVVAWLLTEAQAIGKCVRVRLTNDGQRGAEVEADRTNNDLAELDFGTPEDWAAYRKARTR